MRRRFMIVATVFSVLIFAGSIVLGQTAATESGETRISMKLENADLDEVVAHLNHKFGILVSLEKSLQHSNEQELDFSTNVLAILKKADAGEIEIEPFTKEDRDTYAKERIYSFFLDVQNAKIDDVLSLIANQLPGYQFKKLDGFINFYPTKNRSTVIDALLNLKIQKFSVSGDTEVLELTKLVGKIPEVKEYLSRNGLKLEGFVPNSSSRGFRIMYQRPIGSDLGLKKTTLREVLNQIGRSKQGGWILSLKESGVIRLDI